LFPFSLVVNAGLVGIIAGLHHIESRFCPFFCKVALIFTPIGDFPNPYPTDRLKWSLGGKLLVRDRTEPVENSRKSVEKPPDPVENSVENLSPIPVQNLKNFFPKML
jgi:hypothetical protein